MATIIIYKAQFQYNAVNLFAEELGAGLKKIGHTVLFIDVNNLTNELVQNVFKQKIDYILAFNAINHAALYYVSQKLNIKFIAMLVDHPYFHLQRLTDVRYVTIYDSTHLEYLQTIYENSKQFALFPHGGTLSNDAPLSPLEREIDIFFPGTFSNPNSYFEKIKQIGNPVIRDVCLKAIETVVTSDSIPLETLITSIAKKKNIDITKSPQLYKEFTSQILSLDGFMRSYKRLQTLLELDKNGIPVTIYGNHWPTNLFKHHTVHEAISYEDVINKMGNSKIVLNMPFVPNGPHERLFSAALNGAIPLSDYNPYIEGIFGNTILTYKFTKLSEISSKVSSLLTDKDELIRMSQEARKIACNHTWDVRAKELMQIIKNWGI